MLPGMADPAPRYRYRVTAITGDGPPGVEVDHVVDLDEYHGWRKHLRVGVFDGTTIRTVGVVKTRYIGRPAD